MTEEQEYFTDNDFTWIDRQLGHLTADFPEIAPYKTIRQESGEILNILQFNDKYLKVKLFPREKTALKVIYGISLDEEDKNELIWLWENKHLKVVWRPEGYHEIVFVMGRKSGKSAFSAGIIAIYEIYRIHQIYDPQTRFNLMAHSPISVVFCSASGPQAEELHLYLEAALKNCAYFEQHICNMGKKDVSIYTRYEKDMGYDREGSIRIHTLHSLSRTVRTYNAFLVLMDELAHMIDNKGVFSGDALYKALSPSLALFKKWGRMITLSSPLAKAGKLYDLYALSQSEEIKGIVAFQYATHEFNPNTKKEDFDEEYIKDPQGSLMDYGGEFGEVVDAYLPSDRIDVMFKDDREIAYMGNMHIIYAITVDPSKSNDRYVVCVSHKEIRQINGKPIIFKIIDILAYFEAEVIQDEQGNFRKMDVNIEDVENFIMGLPKRGFRIGVIAYDQFNSTASIQRFNKRNFNALETTFTNKYKETIYSDLKTDLINGTIECYGGEKAADGKMTAMGLARLELKAIQRTIRGKTIHIGHPKVGPVQNDDFADAIANACHVLVDDKIQNKTMGQPVKPLVTRAGVG
jgi:hypothetical protein